MGEWASLMDNDDFFHIWAFQELFKFHSNKRGCVKMELKRILLPTSGLTFSRLGLLCCQTVKPHKAKDGFSFFAWFESSRRFCHLRKKGQPHPGWAEGQAGLEKVLPVLFLVLHSLAGIKSFWKHCCSHPGKKDLVAPGVWSALDVAASSHIKGNPTVKRTL